MVNGTLWVQVIHFCIAYGIINRVLLRKAVVLIHDERDKKTQIENELNREQELLAVHSKKKEESWQAYSALFVQRTPRITAPAPLTVATFYTEHSLSSQEKNHCIEHFTTAIVRKVLHE